VAASLLFWMLVKHAWPAHLEQEVEPDPVAQDYIEHKAQEDRAS
jgi:hypothetical protein